MIESVNNYKIEVYTGIDNIIKSSYKAYPFVIKIYSLDNYNNLYRNDNISIGTIGGMVVKFKRYYDSLSELNTTVNYKEENINKYHIDLRMLLINPVFSPHIVASLIPEIEDSIINEFPNLDIIRNKKVHNLTIINPKLIADIPIFIETVDSNNNKNKML